MTTPTLTPPPDAPTRQSPSTFPSRGDAFLSWMATFATEIASVITWIGEKVAAVQAAAGGSTANAWVSGGSYTAGESYYSPIDFQSYRAKTTHSGLTTDPSLDDTNWASYTVGKDPTFNSTEVTGDLSVTGVTEEAITLTPAATVVIDCTLGTVFEITPDQNTTFTFSNPAASGKCTKFALKVHAGATAYTLDFETNNTVAWNAATAPDAPAANKTAELAFETTDGGTEWTGFSAGSEF